MRFILDTNVWIRYLLTRDEASTIRQLVHVCIEPDHALIMPPEVLFELQSSITKHPYLSQRISQGEVDALIQVINEVVVRTESLQIELTRYVRDPNDDYLVAYGLIYHADYLVTGDQDLLVLGTVEDLQIVRPVDMRNVLEQQGLWSFSF